MTRQRARVVRNNPSALEAQAWRALRTLRDEGIHIRRQHPIGRFVVDFAVARVRLAIELDGGIHDMPDVAAADAARQLIIEQLGWTVLRLPGKLVSAPDTLIATVRTTLRKLGAYREPTLDSDSPHPPPPPLAGRGRRTRDNRVLAPRRVITLRDRLLGLIAQDGPMTVAQYMGAALYDPLNGYYARRAMLGAEGDFITAPEVSQMFGEIVGLWCAQSWMEMGSPAPLQLVELGPGTGALMSDVLRAAKIVPGFRDAARVSFVEVSAPMRARQGEAVAGASWVTHIDDADAGPSLIVGNEFLDCLPIRQVVRTAEGWRERLVGAGEDGALTFGLAPEAFDDDAMIPAALRAAPVGSVAEVAPALPVFVAQLAARLRTHGGRALFIDYGAPTTTAGDSLQAVQGHRKVDPLADPGAADLTAHVDFGTLASLARNASLDVAGPVAQGAWLTALGIDLRAAALSRAQPDKADTIARQHARLTQADGMGELFQVICLSAPGLPTPAGFET